MLLLGKEDTATSISRLNGNTCCQQYTGNTGSGPRQYKSLGFAVYSSILVPAFESGLPETFIRVLVSCLYPVHTSWLAWFGDHGS